MRFFANNLKPDNIHYEKIVSRLEKIEGMSEGALKPHIEKIKFIRSEKNKELNHQKPDKIDVIRNQDTGFTEVYINGELQ